MNRTAIKSLLWLTSGTLLAAAVALPVGLFGSRLGFTVELPQREPVIASSLAEPDKPESTLPELSELASIWQRPVRPAVTPESSETTVEAQPRVKPEPPPPPLRVTLLATAIESDGNGSGSRAVLLDADSQVVVKRVGDITSGARVLRIEAYRVVFDHRGREVILELPDADKHRTGPASVRRDQP